MSASARTNPNPERHRLPGAATHHIAVPGSVRFIIDFEAYNEIYKDNAERGSSMSDALGNDSGVAGDSSGANQTPMAADVPAHRLEVPAALDGLGNDHDVMVLPTSGNEPRRVRYTVNLPTTGGQ